MKLSLLVRILRMPDESRHLGIEHWDLLVRQARCANLLAELHARLAQRGLLDVVPPQVCVHLQNANRLLNRHQHAVRWEVRQIRAALAPSEIPVILLKGVAYVAAGLPPAGGRLFSDIDILVPKSKLHEAEAALMLHGWISTHQDAYDQHYYRTWMHELPPMQHLKRLTTLDVHHGILPQTARHLADPVKLWACASALEAEPGCHVLSPVDMVLHSIVHLFHDGEFDNGLRDLLDIDMLMRHFGGRQDFWDTLPQRAEELGITRALFYALRYAVELLGTPVPAVVMARARRNSPPRMMLACMDQLFRRALQPHHASCVDGLTSIARLMLYIRANWLRMPPLLLMRHLFHKAFLSPKAEARA